MSKCRFFLVLILALISFSSAQALDIVVVDLQKVLSDSKLGKNAKQQLDAEVAKKKSSFQKMQSDLMQSKASIQKQASLLSEEALQKKVDEIREKEKELSRQGSDLQEEMMIKNNAEISKILEKVREVITELQKEYQFSTVIEKDRRLVIFSAAEVDFTEKVIELLDKRS